MGPLAWAYELYVDGEHTGNFGDLSTGKWFVPRWHAFQLATDVAKPGPHLIAIRVGAIGWGYQTRQPHLIAGENRIGNFAALQEAESAYMRADLQSRVLPLMLNSGFLLAGLYFLLLPPLASQGAAFRWLGLILFSRALFEITLIYRDGGPLNVPGSIGRALGWGLGSVISIGITEFPFAMFRRQIPRALRFFELLLVLLVLPVPISYSALVPRYIVLLGANLVPLALGLAAFRKRMADAGITLVVFVILTAAGLSELLSSVVTGLKTTSVAGMPLYSWFWNAGALIWAPILAMQIHKANQRLRDEEQRLRGEMEAARHVQEILLPPRELKVPGFQIDASYQPATEVGGDFFQLFPVFNNSLLVVVGDVSGKGMKAALLVSVIVGALQNRNSDRPGEVLRELNTILVSRSEGGFTTCCCALFGPDGRLTITNAGHLAPYRNGREIQTPPGLPLGIVRDASWEETRVEVQPNDRILWISDGVVEARNGKRDLLGFERAQELAAESASDIAKAAQQFGQDDDITVVSVTRLAVPDYVA